LVDYRDGEGVRRWVTCKTRDQAKKELEKVLRRSGQTTASDVDANIAFRDYSKGWLSEVKASVKPRTHESYEATLRVHLLPALGKVRLRKISRGGIKTILVRGSPAILFASSTRLCGRFWQRCRGRGTALR
jgi:hypothetical protein